MGAVDAVTIRLWVDAIGGSRFVIGYELRDGEHLAARARTGLVPYDLAENRLRRLTTGEREFLHGHLAPAEPLRALASAATKGPRFRVPLGCAGRTWTPTATSTT